MCSDSESEDCRNSDPDPAVQIAAVEQDLARGIPKRTTRKLESRLKWGTVAPIRPGL